MEEIQKQFNKKEKQKVNLGFPFLLGLFLLGIFIVFIFNEHQSFKLNKNYIPNLLLYYGFYFGFHFIYEWFQRNFEFRRNFDGLLIISALIGFVALIVIVLDTSHLQNIALKNIKSVGMIQFVGSILTMVLLFFGIYIPLSLWFCIENPERREKIANQLLFLFGGLFTYTYLQNSLLDNYILYVSNLTNKMLPYLMFLGFISFCLLISEFFNLLDEYQNHDKALKQKVDKIDYSEKYNQIYDFDKYGLAIVKVYKDNKKFFGLIDRLGNEILPPQYRISYFESKNFIHGSRTYPYYKHYPLIKVEDDKSLKSGVIDIHGNWIVELDNKHKEFPIEISTLNKYFSNDESTIIDTNEMIVIIQKNLVSDQHITKGDCDYDKYEGYFSHKDHELERSYFIYEGFYLNKVYDLVKIKIVSKLYKTE